MKEILRKTFESDYPYLCRSAYFEMGSGWYDIIRDLFADFHDYVEREKIDKGKITFSQIKEKFGTLRAHFDLGPDDQDRDDPEFSRHWRALSQFVRKAEERSVTTCEDCGAQGRRRDGGWIRTLCDSCHNVQKKR